MTPELHIYRQVPGAQPKLKELNDSFSYCLLLEPGVQNLSLAKFNCLLSGHTATPIFCFLLLLQCHKLGTKVLSFPYVHLKNRVIIIMGLPRSSVKNLPVMQETQVPFLGQEDPLEKEMTIHPSILAQRIPWTEEPDRLLSMGLQELYRTQRLNHHHQLLTLKKKINPFQRYINDRSLQQRSTNYF